MHVPSLLLSLIPREPDRIDTTRLLRALEAQGIKRTPRAVQQQLHALSAEHPIRCIASSKPYQWQWRKEARGYEFPPMNAHTALTLALAFDYLSPLLPKETLQQLRAKLGRAYEVLDRSHSVGKWKRKVRVLPRGQKLESPPVAPEVLHAIYDALLEERRVVVRYRKRGQRTPETFEVDPLALVLRGPVLTLVASKDGAPRQLLLHRLEAIEAVAGRARAPSGFDLDAFIREGNLSFRKGTRAVKLRARFVSTAVTTLEEAKLAPDQSVGEDVDGRRLLEATVEDTLDLRAFLASYGPLVEVLEPAEIRRELRENAEKTAALYR